MKALSNWLSCSIFLTFWSLVLSTCNKNPYSSEFGDLKTGKYEITMFKEYPSGAKDTLSNEGYGPRKFFDDVLSFEVIGEGPDIAGWGLYYKDYELYYYSELTSGNKSYKITGIQHSETEMKVDFAPIVFPPTPPYDSAYGTVVFKYIEL